MCIQDILRSRSVWFEPLLHRPESSASRRAHSVHLPGRAVAKCVLVRADCGFVLAVLAATCRIDWSKLETALGLQPLGLADEVDAERLFGDCESGTVPPFGHLYGVPTLVDSGLLAGTEIVFDAHMRHDGIRMRLQDYLAVESPQVADFAETITPRRARASRRRAG